MPPYAAIAPMTPALIPECRHAPVAMLFVKDNPSADPTGVPAPGERYTRPSPVVEPPTTAA